MDHSGLKRAFQELFNVFECFPEPADYELFEQKKKLLILLSDVENSSVAVFDMHRGEYAFLQSRFDDHLHYPLNDLFKKKPSYFMDLMPEKDLAFTIDTIKKTFSWLEKQESSKRKEYKLVFEYHLSDPAGNLYSFLQQCVILEQDNSGNTWMVLILNDMVPGKTNSDHLLRKVFHIPTGKIVLFKDAESSSDVMLSARETEILGLLSQGYQSKEISDRLYISVNTVNNHRQHIISKLNTDNTNEAIRFARSIGII